MANPGYQPAALGGDTVSRLPDTASARWVRSIAQVLNNVLSGRMNAVLPITLTANSTTTTIIDARITFYSALSFCPTSKDAAAIAGSLYASSQKNGQATLTHLKTAETDCTFNLLIIG